jgi:hypothetical protein
MRGCLMVIPHQSVLPRRTHSSSCETRSRRRGGALLFPVETRVRAQIRSRRWPTIEEAGRRAFPLQREAFPDGLEGRRANFKAGNALSAQAATKRCPCLVCFPVSRRCLLTLSDPEIPAPPTPAINPEIPESPTTGRDPAITPNAG